MKQHASVVARRYDRWLPEGRMGRERRIPLYLVEAANELLKARDAAHWGKVKDFECAILRSAGIIVENLDRTSNAEVKQKSLALPPLGTEVLAFAMFSIALSRLGFQDNRDGEGAFFTAEKALALNPFNSEIVRTAWAALRKNQTVRGASISFQEIDREMVVVIAAVDNYLQKGVKLVAPDFFLPANWKQTAPQWRRHAGWALENYAGLLEARARELRKRSVGLDEVMRLQSIAENAARRALEVSGAPFTDEAIASIAYNRDAPQWETIDRSQYARVARSLRILSKISSARKGRDQDTERFASAASAAEQIAIKHRDFRVSEKLSLGHFLSRDAFLQPVDLTSVGGAERGTLSVGGEGGAKRASEFDVLIVPARPAPGASPIHRLSNGGAQKNSPEQRAAPPSAAACTWPEHFDQVKRRANDVIQLKTLEFLAKQIDLAKLPESIEKTASMQALARSTAYAAAASFGDAEQMGALLMTFAKDCMSVAEDRLTIPSLFPIFEVYGALHALREKRGAMLNRSLKVEVDRLLPLLVSKAAEVAELLDCERGGSDLEKAVSKLKGLFELVRIP